MSGTNQFQPFAIGSGANALTPAAYAALSTLISQGFQSGIANSAQVNTVLRQASFMAAALGQVIANAGLNANDDGTLSNMVAALQTVLVQKTQVVGAARNLRMSLTSASASATFTADEIVVESALGGAAYQLSGFSKVLNIGGTGAGGMDTGSAPVSGYVAVYAIYNPSTGATSIIGVNATSAIAPEIYGGSSMPSGYTASALISVWRTNSSGQFVVGSQVDRLIAFPDLQAFTMDQLSVSSSISGSASISGIVPKNAYSIFGSMKWSSLGGYTSFGYSFTGVNKVEIEGYASYWSVPYSDLILASPQALTYGAGVGSSTFNFSLFIDGYRF